MAFSPLIVVSPHLLLLATIEMVHLQSTFAWLILQYGYKYGPSAGETHYSVCPLCVCTCVHDTSFLWNLSALTCYPLLNNVLYAVVKYPDGRSALYNPSLRFLEGGHQLIHQERQKCTWEDKHFKIPCCGLKGKSKIWSFDLIFFSSFFLVPTLIVDSNSYLQWCADCTGSF